MFEELAPLSPLFFFQVAYKAKYLPLSKKTFFSNNYLLPRTSEFSSEEEFAKVFFAWHEEGIHIHAEIAEEMENASFSNYRSGDALEVFIDTRDLKSRKALSPFCHHFVIFGEKVNGFFGHEITRFRAEGGHPLCHPRDISVEADIKPKKSRLTIYLPHYSLYGFDPLSFQRLGFSYRVNRTQKSPQSFSVNSEEFNLSEHPNLWASLRMEKA